MTSDVVTSDVVTTDAVTTHDAEAGSPNGSMNRTIRRIALAACILGVFPTAIISGSNALFFLSAFILGLAPATYLFGIISLRGLRAVCETASPVLAGEDLEIPVEVSNPGALPRFNISARVHLPPHLHPSVRHLSHTAKPGDADPSRGRGKRALCATVPFLGGGSRAQTRCRVRTEMRGCFTLGPLSLVHSDPLNLAEVERRIPGSLDLVVHPRPLGVPLSPILSGDLAGAERTARARGSSQGTDFYGIRPYRPGDEWRRIHWRTTARTGDLMVVERESLSSFSLMAIIDMTTPTGDSPDAPFEILISLAAQVADEAIRRMSLLYIYLMWPDGTLSAVLERSSNRLAAMDVLARLDPNRPGAGVLPTDSAGAPESIEVSAVVGAVRGGNASLAILTHSLDDRTGAVADVCRRSSWPGAIMLLCNEGKEIPHAGGRGLPVWGVIQRSGGTGYDVEPLARG